MRLQQSILSRLRNDWHFLLLIIFFVTHGYAEFTGLIPLADLAMMLLALVAIGLVLFWLSRRIFKDVRKAALFTTCFMAIFLFFGAFQDFLGRYQTTAALAQLKIFFPLSLVCLAAAFIFLKKSSRKFARLNIFLNALLAMYIIVDVGVIGFRLLSPGTPDDEDLAQHGLSLSACDTCARPPVYFIVMDEYAGAESLKGHFNYDNSGFEDQLSSQGFRVNKSTTSNYVFTIYSIASTLGMDYIPDLGEQSMTNHFGYRKASAVIADNVTMRFFRGMGYRINNHSYFKMHGAPVLYKSDYLPAELDLITDKTMYSRVANNLVRYLARKFNVAAFKERRDFFEYDKNEAMMSEALQNAYKKNAQPSFTYMHLMMPHQPYRYDSLGAPVTPFWERKSYTRADEDNAYLQYLMYTNRRVGIFISELMQATSGQAIIILMSDHGYRRSQRQPDWPYHTLNAVYLPRRNYNAWYDGMSNVNQFRALLNAEFNQRLPMLKDSLVR